MIPKHLLAKLKPGTRVLLAGAGGGCDVYCCLPIFFELRELGCDVFLSNISFANLERYPRTKLPQLVEMRPEFSRREEYAPEWILAQWLYLNDIDTRFFAIFRVGARPIADAYKSLAEELSLDAVIAVDGGTDALMRGDEFSLATPEEDVATLFALSQLKLATKALVCTAFGVDAFHGICHAQFLEAAAALNKANGCHGVTSLQNKDTSTAKYIDAVEILLREMPTNGSVVNASMISAIAGEYGDVHRIRRTRNSLLWINPLMSLLWWFDLDAVAERNLYLDRIAETYTYQDLSEAIIRFRASLKQHRDFEPIPV